MGERPRVRPRAGSWWGAWGVIFGLACCACATSARALETDVTPESVASCMRANLPRSTAVQDVEMISRDRLGSERTISAHILWKRFDDGYSRVLVRFTAPEDISGAAFLLIETEGRADMFLYLPELRKTRRITTQTLRGSIYGTDFSYEDFERLQGFVKGEQRRQLPDAEIGGRAVVVIEARPAPGESSPYTRVVSWIDRETCVPLRTELYERGDRLRKLLLADPERVTHEGESWVPRELEMRDLRDETLTRLRLLSFERGVKIPDRSFKLGRLGRGRTP